MCLLIMVTVFTSLRLLTVLEVEPIARGCQILLGLIWDALIFMKVRLIRLEIAGELGCVLGDGRRFEKSRTKMTVNGRDASVDELASLNSLSDKCFLEMEDAKYNGTLTEVDDIASYIDWDHRFSHLYAHLLGGLNASDAHQQSVLDYLKTGHGLDYPVVGGLGKLIEKWASGFLGQSGLIS